MKKKLVSVLLVACMALSLTACGGNNKKDNAANNTNTEKTDGADDASGSDAGNAGESNEGGSVTNSDTNVLYINLASEPKYLDPALSSTVDGGCLAVNTFAGLYTYDEEGKLIPDLATAMPEVSEDGTVYTVKIKESKWSNGDDLKAQDFIYSWNRAIAQETAADYAYLFDIIARKDDGTLSVEATDDYTLVITLISPCPYFNDLMAFPTFLPVHQASVEAADLD